MARSLTPLALALCLSAPLSGCSGKGMDTPPGDDGGGMGGEEDLAKPVEGDVDMAQGGGGLNLTGVWASRVVNAQIFDGPLGKETVFVTNLARLEVTHDGGLTTTNKSTVCSVTLSPYMKNQTIYPDAAVAAIPQETATATLAKADIGAAYTPAQRVQLIGWRATMDPRTEMLPQKPDDPRVIDADKDNKPGVTLEVKGLISGKVYIVNRSIIDFAAKIESRDRIAGSSHTEQLQVVLDSDNPLLKNSKVTTTPDPDASKSTFTMVRLGAMNSCADIKQNADKIFK